MTIEELKVFIAARHKPELALEHGMVHQIWEDGEHTCQKSGELLWQRTLHCFEGGFTDFPKEIMPVVEKNHGYCFCTNDGAREIRQAMRETIG